MTERACILIDLREKLALRFSDGVDTEVVHLTAGDYSLKGHSADVAIERKSLPDLVACCGWERERFLDCCWRLSGYDLAAIVVEASLADVQAHAYRSRIRPSSVIGTTIAIHVDFGVPTIWAGDAETAANIVERMLVRVWRRAREARAA